MYCSCEQVNDPSADPYGNSSSTSDHGDYGSIKYELTGTLLQKLQCVRKASAWLAWLVTPSGCRCWIMWITPILRQLHWLPVNSRVEVKTLVLTYQAVHGLGHRYLSDLLVPYHPERTFRSTDAHLLVIPRTCSTDSVTAHLRMLLHTSGTLSRRHCVVLQV